MTLLVSKLSLFKVFFFLNNSVQQIENLALTKICGICTVKLLFFVIIFLALTTSITNLTYTALLFHD